VFLIIFFVIFAIRPTVTTISSLVGDINAKEIQQTQLKTKINQIIKAQDLYSQVQGKYSLIAQGLPDSPSYYQAANQIHGATSISSVSVTGLSFVLTKTGNSPTDHLNSYSVPISFPASFSQTTTVLDNLLQNRRLLQIPSISFSLLNPASASVGSSNTVSPGNITASFNATIYYWDTFNGKN
ncbi:MAG: hypothetical protein NTU85_03690, partial [Candidatus Kaiserbacteria bacterium]|nr:hypothetical protein [Candidatus Kaiserbacteria bacterium]